MEASVDAQTFFLAEPMTKRPAKAAELKGSPQLGLAALPSH
jgi:hypothetical protein